MTVLAIDQGTSSTKAFLLRPDGGFRPVGTIKHRQYFPASGWVEHDAEELASNIKALLEEAVRKEPHIAGIALANQGETVVAWDRRTERNHCIPRLSGRINAHNRNSMIYLVTRASLRGRAQAYRSTPTSQLQNSPGFFGTFPLSPTWRVRGIWAWEHPMPFSSTG